MLKKFLKNDKGLTLVELLAVIVILGIIAAIAVPSIGGIINKSKDDAKVAEALQIISAARLANAENPDTISWESTATSSALDKYVSKVKDNVYTVNYNKTTNKYTITGHDAASVINNGTTTVTEDELSKEASK
ncbi:type IV pilin protein [[Bacillus] enclensis]|uniref:type IV pilin protein n=1 Tax=[Bacillus] enclensis TaxID=1402860 RepID=UPI0018DD0FAA|nr:type II secretion system protein [[Bacillus] enclensis]MBH9967088.1 type II secretion system protein [[Bacillus] enclensis]